MKDRLVTLDGTYNFRDLGGYVGHDNKVVKKGVLFRADTLSKLSDDDVKILESMSIKTIIDFRSVDERYNNEDRVIDGATVYNYDPIASIAEFAGSGKGEMNNFDLNSIDEDMVTMFLSSENAKFVESERGQEVYRNMLTLFLDKDKGAFVQHCTAGKDRTGYGSALILLLLGVSRDDVMSDYLLTNDANKNKPLVLNDLDVEDEALMKSMKLFEGVKAEYLDSALDLIFDKYDGVENYTMNVLGFSSDDIETLRDNYLE